MRDSAPDPQILAQWGLSQTRLVATTNIAQVWQVQTADGNQAALKVYFADDMAGETPGLDYLHAKADLGAVKLLARAGRAVLLEWCNAEPLGDWSRAGRDDDATQVLTDVIARLWSGANDPSDTAIPLTHATRALRDLDLGQLAIGAEFARDLAWAQDRLAQLLASTAQTVWLHGDLHHDNVLRGADGWRVIDPKSYAGDPHYEVANAFRNPIGAGQLCRDPARAHRMCHAFCTHLGLTQARVFNWAAVHVALSLAWGGGSVLIRETDADLLHELVKIAKAHPL